MISRCPATKETCLIVETVTSLVDEVIRLSAVVNRLEARSTGRSVQLRDLSLTVAGVMLSSASVLWMLVSLQLF